MDLEVQLLVELRGAPLGGGVEELAEPESVFVYHDDLRIAAHARGGSGPRSTQKGHLPEERAEYGNRCRPNWEERAAAIGPEGLDLQPLPIAE